MEAGSTKCDKATEVYEMMLRLRELYKAVKIPHTFNITVIQPCDINGNPVVHDCATRADLSNKIVFSGYDEELSDVISDYCTKKMDELKIEFHTI